MTESTLSAEVVYDAAATAPLNNDHTVRTDTTDVPILDSGSTTATAALWLTPVRPSFRTPMPSTSPSTAKEIPCPFGSSRQRI